MSLLFPDSRCVEQKASNYLFRSTSPPRFRKLVAQQELEKLLMVGSAAVRCENPCSKC
jgi:hypothetical protein